MDAWEKWRSGFELHNIAIMAADRTASEKLETASKALLRTPENQTFKTDIYETLAYASEELLPNADELRMTNAYFPQAQETSYPPGSSSIIDLLRVGVLPSYGFLNPRKPVDSPHKIPQDCWDGFIDLVENYISGNGLTFVGVRVHIPHEQLTLRTKPGRPSRIKEIHAAFRELTDRGSIDTSLPYNHHFEAIRREVFRLHPELDGDETGLSDKVLARELKKLIQRQKNNLSNL